MVSSGPRCNHSKCVFSTRHGAYIRAGGGPEHQLAAWDGRGNIPEPGLNSPSQELLFYGGTSGAVPAVRSEDQLTGVGLNEKITIIEIHDKNTMCMQV